MPASNAAAFRAARERALHLHDAGAPRWAHTDAGGDDAEESAVCYLQVLMAESLPRSARERMCRDMDEWGYSFRLGSAAQWFAEDAEDARCWLERHGLIDAAGRVTRSLRS